MNARERAILFGKNVKPATLDESALAYAVAHGGGSEPTYETVAEIQVGEMVETAGIFSYTAQDAAQTELIAGEIYYLNDATNPGIATDTGGEVWIYFNVEDLENFTPKDPTKTAAAFGYENGAAIIGSTTDLSNTTVRILKAASAPSGSGKMVVRLTESDVDGETVFSADKTVAEILAADAAGQVVECVWEGQHCAMVAMENSSSASCVFSTVILEESDFTGLFIVGSNGKQEGSVDAWVASESEVEIPSNLKPTYEFGFSMSADQQGNFSVTADQGSTFAAIKAALAKTPNVYAIANNSGQRSRTIFTADGEGYLLLNALHRIDNVFVLLSVMMDSSDTITTVSKIIT